MVLNDLSVTFIPTEVLKHSRKGKPLDKFEYKTLCLIVCLKEYISRRNKHERLITLQLIITLRKPFKGASIDILRWIKDIFTVNVVNFSPHSKTHRYQYKWDRYKRLLGKPENLFKILWQRNNRISAWW